MSERDRHRIFTATGKRPAAPASWSQAAELTELAEGRLIGWQPGQALGAEHRGVRTEPAWNAAWRLGQLVCRWMGLCRRKAVGQRITSADDARGFRGVVPVCERCAR